MHRQADDEELRLPFRRSRARARRSARLPAGASIVVSGRALRVIVVPTATPMRRVPKSNASTVARGRWSRARHACPTSSDRREKSMPSRRIAAGSRCSAGSVEHDVGVGLDREPRVLRELLLELAGRPAGVAERHEDVAGAVAAPDRLEHVLRRGEADVVRDRRASTASCRADDAARSRGRPAPDRRSGRAPRAARRRSSGTSICSNSADSVMSIGRLTTMPSAPSSLCSHTKVSVCAKCGSAMAGMAIRK